MKVEKTARRLKVLMRERRRRLRERRGFALQDRGKGKSRASDSVYLSLSDNCTSFSRMGQVHGEGEEEDDVPSSSKLAGPNPTSWVPR